MSAVQLLDQNSIAPWAEVVPGVGPMTVADLLDYPDEDGYRYEVVEGVLVRMAGSKPRALFVTDRLYRRLGDYVEDNDLTLFRDHARNKRLLTEQQHRQKIVDVGAPSA